MNFDEMTQKIGVAFVVFRNEKMLIFVNLLIFIEKVLRNDWRVEIFFLVLFDIVFILVVFVMNFEETQGVDQRKSLYYLISIVLEHICD